MLVQMITMSEALPASVEADQSSLPTTQQTGLTACTPEAAVGDESLETVQ